MFLIILISILSTVAAQNYITKDPPFPSNHNTSFSKDWNLVQICQPRSELSCLSYANNTLFMRSSKPSLFSLFYEIITPEGPIEYQSFSRSKSLCWSKNRFIMKNFSDYGTCLFLKERVAKPRFSFTVLLVNLFSRTPLSFNKAGMQSQKQRSHKFHKSYRFLIKYVSHDRLTEIKTTYSSK